MPGLLSIVIAALAVVTARPANAVPAFAEQTGQPCQACHVGGFGPQLTPFGRNFKLHGYTMRAVEKNNPLAVMAIASYLRTNESQTEPPADSFKTNNNFALDQVSVFLAGGIGQHVGGFVQTTYDGVGKAFAWDNIDLRATTETTIKGADVLLGASLNNSPTVQDVWNSTPAWGFPYTDSGLAPSPSASPLLADGLAQNTIGLTTYAWINSNYYIEAGAYGSPGARTLTRLGADPLSPGNINGLAPYGRLAFQKADGAQNIQVGLFGLRANIYPERDHSAHATDRYTDVGLDGSYQLTRTNGDIFSVNARYLDERRSLAASEALGLAENLHGRLKDTRIDASYYWRNKFGATVQAFNTSGTSDAILYADTRIDRPKSSGLNLQLDGTLFGGADAPMRQRFNVRAGVQYTMYSKFDGASHNYDGAGRNASDNNTLRVFTWLAF